MKPQHIIVCYSIALSSIFLTLPCTAQSLRAFPGARIYAVTWTDINGKFWMFGGLGFSNVTTSSNQSGMGSFNDLWCYDPLLGEWTWVAGTHLVNKRGEYGSLGIPANNTNPGGRKTAASWTDSTGALWMFGGFGFSAESIGNGILADLWKFQPSNGQWTWVGGPSVDIRQPVFGEQGVPSPNNLPYFVLSVIAWNKQGSDGAWLYAGSNVYEASYLWLYNLTSYEWTWVHNVTDGFEVRGEQGVSNSSVRPRQRYEATFWIGIDNSFWLFGGQGSGLMSDTWRYNIKTYEWTWVHGNSSSDQLGVLGDLGKPSNQSIPAARSGGISWTDADGMLWLFGGKGYGNTTFGFVTTGMFDDFWFFNPTTNQWTWMGGSLFINSIGRYGTQGVPSKYNTPRSRQNAVSWLGPDGTLWMFGGETADTGLAYMNDLWRYNISSGEWTWMGGSKEPGEYGVYLTPASPPTPVSGSPTEPSPSANPASVSQSEDITHIVVPAVVVPLVAAGVIIGVLIGLKKRKSNKEQRNTQTDNPLAVLSTSSDRRMIPYSSVTLEKEIGAGSYGKVYLGKWQATKVAVKVSNNSISTAEFFKEAEFQLNIPPHPNIVQLLGVSTDGPHPLVILEYCNNGSLDLLLFDTNQPISDSTQIHIATSIAKGLYHLHTNNIVHRDLAARNILMHNGEPKISDFGMSRVIKEAAQLGKTASNIGPIRWMAPESVKSQTYSFKSDVWMFGIILYEITARQEPHIGEDILDVGIKIRDSGATPTIPTNCPPLLREIMQVCWLRDPNLRPTMEQLCHKLDEYVDST